MGSKVKTHCLSIARGLKTLDLDYENILNFEQPLCTFNTWIVWIWL